MSLLDDDENAEYRRQRYERELEEQIQAEIAYEERCDERSYGPDDNDVTETFGDQQTGDDDGDEPAPEADTDP